MTEAKHGDLRRAAARVTSTLDDAYAWLDDLADRLHAVHERAHAEGRLLCTADLSALRDAIFSRLRSQSDMTAGTGVVLAEDALADRAHWLEWWQKRRHGAPAFLEVEHDPDSIGFYDYAAAEWFDTPRRTGRRVAVGPYVDYAGTDEYVLTFTRPVLSRDRFLGIAGVDVRADAFEALLLREVGPAHEPVALTNNGGRVIASNTTHTVAGSLLPSGAGAARWPVEAPHTGRHPAACTGLPWSLVVLDATS